MKLLSVKSKASKPGIFLATVSLAFAPLALGPSSPALANSATISDPSSVCKIAVTSPTITIDATSAAISLVGSQCVVKFLAAGSYSFTVPAGVDSLDYIVVGGGGGGGAGGGGGGGVLQGSNFAVSAGSNLDVTVGAGGAGGRGGNDGGGPMSTSGSSSVFATVTALGGGLGGQLDQHAGDGASGGGGTWDCADISCIGHGTPGQGTDGTNSFYGGYGGAGGGGGAGSVGSNPPLYHIGGKGGDGVSSSITGTPTIYGGGGGGGINSNDGAYCGLNAPGTSDADYYCTAEPITTGGGAGGAGGGGRGSSWGFNGGIQGEKANGTPGEANTGGGGGGTDPEDSFAYAGGSGIVIVSFKPISTEEPVVFDQTEKSGLAATGATDSPLPAVGFALLSVGLVLMRVAKRSAR